METILHVSGVENNARMLALCKGLVLFPLLPMAFVENVKENLFQAATRTAVQQTLQRMEEACQSCTEAGDGADPPKTRGQ